MIWKHFFLFINFFNVEWKGDKGHWTNIGLCDSRWNHSTGTVKVFLQQSRPWSSKWSGKPALNYGYRPWMLDKARPETAGWETTAKTPLHKSPIHSFAVEYSKPKVSLYLGVSYIVSKFSRKVNERFLYIWGLRMMFFCALRFFCFCFCFW